MISAAQRSWERGQADSQSRLLVAADRLSSQDPAGCLEVLLDPAAQFDDDDAWPSRLAGHAYMITGQYEQAATSLNRAVGIDPYLVVCWFQLGQIHETVKRPRLAVAYYRRGLTLEDRTHDCALALSRLLMRMNRVSRAIDALRDALTRDRRSADLHLELAKILRRRARRLRRRQHIQSADSVLAGAVECLEIAAAAKPTPRTHLVLSITQQRLGRFDAAEQSLQRLLKLDPLNATVRLRLANSKLERGRINEAVADYEQLLAIRPNHAMTHFRYTRSRKFDTSVASASYAEQLADLLSEERSTSDLIHLNFAIAKVLDDSGQYDRAWHHYDRANRLKTGHSESLTRRASDTGQTATGRKASSRPVVQHSIDFFNSAWFERQRDACESELPIFIIGMPRSGTTLCEQILSSHSKVDGAGELKDIERLRNALVRKHNPVMKRRRSVDEPLVKRRNTKTQPVGSQVAYPEMLSTIPDSELKHTAQQYLQKLEKHRLSGERVTDKMPTNFLHLGLIATLFPRATIVHCQRNPMDVIVSSYCQNLNAPFCDLHAIVDYYHQYTRLMAHWQEVIPLSIHTIEYESLINAPEAEVKKLLDHCGLAWEPNCLNFDKNDRAVRTPSKWQVRQPLYSTSVEKWRRFESHLGSVEQAIRNLSLQSPPMD